MKKIMLSMGFAVFSLAASAQYFNEEMQSLYRAAVENNDTLKLCRLQQQIAGVNIQSITFSYLPKLSFGASYTRLNDDIVFPGNLQQLLMGTQQLLIKEKLGLPFNTPLPGNVPLEPVAPIQRKDIFKTNISGQWLLFSGLKVRNGVRAYEHQQKSLAHLSEKQQTALWLNLSEAYDQLALLHESDAIIRSSENVLAQQIKFVNAAISNGLATPLDRKKIELAQQKLEIKKLENNTGKKMLTEKLHQLTAVPVGELKNLHPQIIATHFDASITPAERPELKALDEGIEAKKFAAKAALADYVPKVAAFGQYELREKDLSLFDPKWAVGVKLQWNLFDGLNARNNARKENLEMQALEVQKKAAQDLIHLAYTKARADYELATDKLILKNRELALTQDTYQFVEKQYRNGLTTVTELLNALNDVEKSTFEMKQAVYEQRRAALRTADISGALLNHI